MSWSRERIEELEDALANSECLHYGPSDKETYIKCPFCGCYAHEKRDLDVRHNSNCTLVLLGIKEEGSWQAKG